MSLRQDFLDELRQYQPWDEVEGGMLEQLRQFVLTEPDCYLRTCVPGHLTASAWVTTPGSTHVLLLHHQKLDKWLQPGGHADGEQDLVKVAATELLEEAGVTVPSSARPIFDIDIHPIPARGLDPLHMHYDIRFHWEVPLEIALQKNHESKELTWVQMRDVANLNNSPSVMRMVLKSLGSL